jgi:protein transport protein SEC24
VAFDVFVCANSYCDIATVGVLANKTGGQLFMYPGFHARKDGEAMQRDVFHTLTRRTGSDAVMVVRISAGLKVAEHFGNYFHRRPNGTTLPLPLNHSPPTSDVPSAHFAHSCVVLCFAFWLSCG